MKQRLIDANNLYADYIVTSTTTNTLCHRYISKEQVENAPTVEAIPIEWIKKYIVDNTKTIDDLKYEVGANPVNYYIYPQQITKMLTAWWEKENEKQTVE